MSDVTFNEPQYGSGGSRGPEKSSALSQMVISMGLAKDEAGAQRVLAIVAAAIALIAILVYVFA
jgi:hypothetical protein